MNVMRKQQCRTCTREQVLANFYQTRGRYDSQCRTCKKAYCAERRELKAPEIRAYYREWIARDGNRARKKASYDAWRVTAKGRAMRAESDRIYRTFKRLTVGAS